MWFKKSDIKNYSPILCKNLHGFVLPHAGTKYTGKIISHTLRFKPSKKFTKVIILYYPVSKSPNVQDKYYHEYYVPMKCIRHFINNSWNINRRISFLGINVGKESIPYLDQASTLYIVSADFSHFLPLQSAIELENKAAYSVMFRQLSRSSYIDIIDHPISFKTLYSIIPDSWNLQWIGRSRSPGKEGVGYLSFLLKSTFRQPVKLPDGMFVTVYDKQMNARECLGEWFHDKLWNKYIETTLINKVISNGKSSSRLTGGMNNNIPLGYYTVTYLYNSKKKFIRGYHGIKNNAFYLPEILLENTFTNGAWITKEDDEWKSGNFFMKETIDKLNIKSGISDKTNNYNLYSSEVIHYRL
jgi:hypothetical protein